VFPEQPPPAHPPSLACDIRFIASHIMADPVAAETSISDKEVYERTKEILASLDTENARRAAIAANVLFTYARGSLTYGDASDIVVPLVKELWYKELIDTAWERGEFKALGALRRSSFFLVLAMACFDTIDTSPPRCRGSTSPQAGSSRRNYRYDICSVSFEAVSAHGQRLSTPTPSQADSRAK
jgi:hypothetical protein